MSMKAFRVTGKFKMGKQMLGFNKEFAVADRKLVEEKVYAEFGSKHRAKRRDIKIEKVEELTPDKVVNTSIRMLLEGK